MAEYTIQNIEAAAVQLFEARKLVRFDDLPAGVTQDHVHRFFKWLDGPVPARTFYSDVRFHARMRWLRGNCPTGNNGRTAEEEAELLLASYFRGTFASWLTFEAVIADLQEWQEMGGPKMKVSWATEINDAKATDTAV